MSSKRTSGNEQKSSASAGPTVYLADVRTTIHVQTDGINTSANWILANYEEKGALSEDNLADLAKMFRLPQPILRTLSIEIGNSLDIESLANIAPVHRDVAIARANEALEKAATWAKRAEHDLAAIDRLLSPRSDAFALSTEQRSALASAKHRTEAAKEAASGLHDAIALLLDLPGSAAVVAPTDKRRIRDGRRQLVVETCCYAWRDAGRTVSYTTRPDRTKDPRGGPLIDFIQAVVEMVTDPPFLLSGETIRKDIDRWVPDGPLEGPPEVGVSIP